MQAHLSFRARSCVGVPGGVAWSVAGHYATTFVRFELFFLRVQSLCTRSEGRGGAKTRYICLGAAWWALVQAWTTLGACKSYHGTGRVLRDHFCACRVVFFCVRVVFTS